MLARMVPDYPAMCERFGCTRPRLDVGHFCRAHALCAGTVEP
jgi:hypothetical protein